MRSQGWKTLASAMFALALVPIADEVHGQAIQRSFLNLGFEAPLPGCSTVGVSYVNSDIVPGWSTTHSSRNDNFCGGPGPTIEIWYPGNPFFNLPHQGRTFAELNAFEYSTLYQTVCLMEGDEITWKFAHRGRGGDDEMVFQLATHDSDRTSWGGTTDIVQSRSPAGTGTPSQICGPLGTCLAPTQENTWSVYEGTFTWSSPASLQRFGFVPLESVGGYGAGNFVDSISLSGMATLVELDREASSSPEDGAPFELNVLVSGNVPDGETLEIELSVTHGSTDAADISWSEPLRVTVPPGDYAGEAFPVAISVIPDGILEADEQFSVAIKESSRFRIGSTSACGEIGRSSMTHTIVNDDIVSTSKKLIGEEGGNQEDLVEPGETLTYEVTITNESAGGVSIYDLGDALDANLTYVPNSTRGTAGASEPEGSMPLIWRGIRVESGQSVTVIYDAKVADSLPPGTKLVRNIAFSPKTFDDDGGGYPGEEFCLENPENCTTIGMLDISLVKIADITKVVRGMSLPFTIQLTNHSSKPIRDMVVRDVFPAGFRLVEGSATVDGVPAAPVQNGRELQFTVPHLEPDATASISLQMQTLPTVEPGEYNNRAVLRDGNGREVAVATAQFAIAEEAIFDCGEIIGKVFDDKNRNGYQDGGEPGIPAARVTAVDGIVVTTDDEGRFNMACADLPQAQIGSNLLMKLDPRSLPSGYRILSENPRAVRLSAGKMTSINFATSIARVVRLDLNGAAFVAGSLDILPQWHQGLRDLIKMLELEPSVLRITIEGSSEGKSLAGRRLEAMRALITDLWRQKGGRYRLEIEARVLLFGRNRELDAERAFLIIEPER